MERAKDKQDGAERRCGWRSVDGQRRIRAMDGCAVHERDIRTLGLMDGALRISRRVILGIEGVSKEVEVGSDDLKHTRAMCVRRKKWITAT